MKLGAVVLHYRFWPGVRRALDALLAQTRPPDRVIVVDNASDDGSLEQLQACYPGLDLMPLDENLGYSGGMNAGLRCLVDEGHEAVLLLTHECVLRADALAILVEHLEAEPSAGGVGPLIGRLSSPAVVWSAGGIVDRRWQPRHISVPSSLRHWEGRDPHDVQWLDGACILLRAEAVRSSGWLDERFFLYLEDCEYAYRLRSKGWRVQCVPSAVALQEPGGVPPYLGVRNRLHFVAVAGTPLELVREALWECARLLAGFLGLRRRSRDDLAEGLRGLLAFLRGERGQPRGSAGHRVRTRTDVVAGMATAGSARRLAARWRPWR